NRHGSYDVFVSPAVGGRPRRLTFDSGHDTVTGWTPDGKGVVFTSTRSTAYPYQAECYVVPFDGGAERKLTLFEGKEAHFAPDGKTLAFVRGPGLWYRRGYRGSSNDEIWLSNADGSAPRRFTSFDGQDGSPMWSPDGKTLYYVSEEGSPRGCANVVARPAGSPEQPNPPGPPSLRGKGGDVPPTWPARVIASAARREETHLEHPSPSGGGAGGGVETSALPGAYAGQPNPPGPPSLKVKGGDVPPTWLTPVIASAARQEETHLKHPSPSGGGAGGGVDHVRASGTFAFLQTGTPARLTTHSDDTVRRARISADGEWIVYECGADLWVVSTRAGPPRRLAIEVNADDKANTERAVTYTRDATEFALSPDEEHAVVSVHGELFLTRLPDGGRATRLTDHPAYDHGASFSPDGKSILFASDRGGVEDLYLLEPDDPEHPELAKAHTFKVKPLTRTPEAESAARFNPKGDRIGFLRSGKLWTMKPDGSDQKTLVDVPQVFDFDWSPDGKYVVFARMDGSFASEVYIAPTDGSEPPRNVSRYATYNGEVSWSATGGKIAFIGQRRGTYTPHVLSLLRPAAPGAPKAGPGDIDWDDLHLRGERVTTTSADAVSISPNGTQVAFRHSGTGDDLWVAAAAGGSLTRVTTGNLSPRQIRWAKKSTGLIYFLTGTGELRSVRAGGLFASPGSSADPPRVTFQARMVVRRDEEFAEMFAQSWRGLSDYFYDPAHHGTDWAAVRSKYLALVPHVAMKEDLYALISLMLGELNASHLGISGTLPTAQEPTADLGLVFDPAYHGPGLKVADVLKRGPADKRGLGIRPGDVVVAIDRTELTPKVNVSQLLNNKAGEGVLLDVASDPADKKTRRRVEVYPIARDKSSDLMYDRWVDANAAAVAKQSGGKIGYIHIPGMDEAGLEKFMRALYSDNFDKEAVVIDVRYNGGGFTHDQVLNYLSGKEHTFFRQRDGGEGLVLRNYDRRFTRPVAVMANNRSYSDAEIFPHAFRSLGLGKVVGQATGGFVIGTTSTRLIDGSTLRLPRTGVYTAQGVNMEKQGVIPDVAVETDPADYAKGIDTQLARAVVVLADDVVAWRRTRGTPPAGASPTGTAPAAVPAPSTAPLPRTAPASPAVPAIPPATE
ncbi:MAG TPA: S41 family peptidase, partial [Urbifossiella sp.]|nr:S41 family peptidase [Urbifossiella sp.]